MSYCRDKRLGVVRRCGEGFFIRDSLFWTGDKRGLLFNLEENGERKFGSDTFSNSSRTS